LLVVAAPLPIDDDVPGDAKRIALKVCRRERFHVRLQQPAKDVLHDVVCVGGATGRAIRVAPQRTPDLAVELRQGACREWRQAAVSAERLHC